MLLLLEVVYRLTAGRKLPDEQRVNSFQILINLDGRLSATFNRSNEAPSRPLNDRLPAASSPSVVWRPK